MKLRQLIKAVRYPGIVKVRSFLKNQLDIEVKGISSNSQFVKRGFLFVAVKGATEDGRCFIGQAIAQGAIAVVVEARSSLGEWANKITVIEVKDTRSAAAWFAAAFYRYPSKRINVIGITGTNGKTTVSYLIEAILKESRYSPAVIGTVNYRFKGKLMPSLNTTPGPVELQGLLDDMVKVKVDYVVMEVSSHALDQRRIEGIEFQAAIFTNLTQDHLDYHKTPARYFKAKSQLFCGGYTVKFIIINNDDSYGRKLRCLSPQPVVTYGIDRSAEVMAKDIHLSATSTQFSLCAGKRTVRCVSQLIGKHNIYNMLAAAGWALRAGIKMSVIQSAFRKCKHVPGRLEKVPSPKEIHVFVDYAHTEDALFNVINALRQISSRRIIVVFGCGGERDKTKRPKMGRVVSELADFAVITNDNPRSENPRDIINDIKRGIKKSNYCVIPDRLEAIKRSLSLAKSEDVVLIAGKGHEQYQILKEKVIHFDDREAIKACLKLAN